MSHQKSREDNSLIDVVSDILTNASKEGAISIVGIVVERDPTKPNNIRFHYSCSNLMEMPTILDMALPDAYAMLESMRTDTNDAE